MKELTAYIPYDKETGHFYINAVGSTPKEAWINLDLCEENDKVFERVEVKECKIILDTL